MDNGVVPSVKAANSRSMSKILVIKVLLIVVDQSVSLLECLRALYLTVDKGITNLEPMVT